MAKIVFMGTPEFAVPSLERLVEAGFTPCAVVTGPDRQRGRGRKTSSTPVKVAAERLGITEILQPESVKDPEFARQIRSLDADVFVIVAYRILPPAVFSAARLGAFNLHGSLLPKFRGAAPIHRAVMAGVTETGVTTFFLKEKVDTGNVIMNRAMPVGPNETTGEVHDRMMEMGADVVLETLRSILDGAAETSPQDESLVSAAPKIFRDECRIDWNRPRADLHNFIRGLSPFPGAWTHFGEAELKIFRSRIPADLNDVQEPGIIMRAGQPLFVACADGPLEILELQQQGRRRMQADEFIRGFTLEAGALLS